MKVVAVQRGLEHIKNQLNLLGYETLFFDEMIQREFSNNTSSILINANDKSIYDIVQIIESRLYSPLL
jgi:hypothetical protein